MPEPPASCFTNSPITFFASPNNIHVRSPKYSSLSMPANPGFLLRLMANTLRALSASMIDMRHIGIDFVHLDEIGIGDVRFGEQHVHVTRHPAGDRMNRELHRVAPLLQLIVELSHFVQRLRDRH